MVTHPFLPQGCAALALPPSLLLHPAGNVGGVEEAMSMLRGVESMNEGGAADGKQCARRKKRRPWHGLGFWGFGRGTVKGWYVWERGGGGVTAYPSAVGACPTLGNGFGDWL